MANYNNLNDLFTDIANAIRTKSKSTAKIIADTFPSEIDKLRTGFDYNNKDVVAIPDYAFYGCEDLNNVDCINVTSIGESAFENCNNLETVVLCDSVKSIGDLAFSGCTSLTSITFEGTIVQWDAISFGHYWNGNESSKDKIPATEVVCSDGTVSLN